MDEILGKLADIRSRTRIVLVLDTLENLKRGGRARLLVGAAERMAKALNIKPVINLVDGELRLMGAVAPSTVACRAFAESLSRWSPSNTLPWSTHASSGGPRRWLIGSARSRVCLGTASG